MWMWPNARISVMGGTMASEVLAQVRSENAMRRQEPWSETAETEFKSAIEQQYEKQGHPYYASARLWDDGVIDPADTRRILSLALSAALQAPIQPTRFGVFRM